MKLTVRQLPEGNERKDFVQIRVSKVVVQLGNQKNSLGAQSGATEEGRMDLVFLQATQNGAL
jgi:hypothetical protein